MKQRAWWREHAGWALCFLLTGLLVLIFAGQIVHRLTGNGTLQKTEAYAQPETPVYTLPPLEDHVDRYRTAKPAATPSAPPVPTLRPTPPFVP